MEKNQQIEQSIQYAEMIQRSVLPKPEDILKDYNNIIGAQNYKIIFANDQYHLEPQLPSLSQKERDDFRIKITDEVTKALGGDNTDLNKRLMSDVFKQKPIDRLGTSDDKNLD